MNELIQAATRALNAVASYYEKQAGVPSQPNLPLRETAPTATPEAPMAGEQPAAKPGRTRKPKVEPAPETLGEKLGLHTPASAPVAGAALIKEAVMTEAQSEERLKVVGEAFVQRFSKTGDAVGEVKATIESRFKVTRLRDLVHAQRVELIGVLEGRIKEIDSKQTQAAAAPVPAVGLGL